MTARADRDGDAFVTSNLSWSSRVGSWLAALGFIAIAGVGVLVAWSAR